MSQNSTNYTGAAGANPFGELTKMLEQFKIPGVDMSAIADARRQDVESLVQANKAVYEGMQALANKQTEMLQQAMQGFQSAGASGMSDPAQQTEMARKAYEKALTDMKGLADIAQKSQADAMAIIMERAAQNMQEIKKMTQPK
ncbi:TIGR01841 family phasin [Pusillimonas sp. ANT_WB101]|uniref:TIGR01841 family phasin n=1 Tax=Pusillimonas sp. ANT_WB101 TaxID=2597356 RepID=UPI0011F02C92|nr:TIGR01841 family phasin [Pusillimonas sp. ANT_WB101]KAA0892742.1 phasin family protein [Pusillimonas sp. ANT_WB101]